MIIDYLLTFWLLESNGILIPYPFSPIRPYMDIDDTENDVCMNRDIVDIAFDILKKREQEKFKDKRFISINN